ncbi:exocyst complex component 3-like protein 4 [Pelodytes ibericus]
MENKHVKSSPSKADNKSNQSSTWKSLEGEIADNQQTDWENYFGGKKNNFLRNISSFRKSKNSKTKAQHEKPHSPEKTEPTEFQHSIGKKLRSSFRALKKDDVNNSNDQCRNVSAISQVEEICPTKELLSVMQINELIHTKHLPRAFGSIKVMEETLMEEFNSNIYKDNITEFKRKSKDVDLLYAFLFKQVASIVKDSLGQGPVDEQMVASVVFVINEEAKTTKNTVEANSGAPVLGMSRKWKMSWKNVIKESVTERISSVPISQSENKLWLADHLQSLKVNIVQDLLKVKQCLKPLYPEEYDVFGTYVGSFHDALSDHLQSRILPLSLKFSQLYALLDWILNTYTSDAFMAHPDLQPDVHVCSLSLLPDESLSKLKNDYSCALQMTGKHVRESTKLSKDLETSSFHVCMEELATFTTRLQSEFTASFQEKCTDLFAQYLVIYVNSFIKLSNSPKQSDAEPCQKAEAGLNNAIDSLKKHFFHCFNIDTLPHFKKLITKKWLVNNTAFNAIIQSTKEQCQYLQYLITPLDKDFVNGVYRHLEKGYVTQVLKRKMRLTNLKRKKASQKLNRESEALNSTVQELGSDLEHLFSSINCISEIICVRKKEDLILKLGILFENYPDIGEEHVYSIFHLHGMGRRKRRALIDHFRKLKRRQSKHSSGGGSLFSEIEYSTNTMCF